MYKNKITRWWWVRHAVVTAHQGCIYGATDHPCDVSDRQVFENMVKLLPQHALLLTSQLQRTHQTAEALKTAGLKFFYGPRVAQFNEQSFGDWEGQTFDAISQALPQQKNHKQKSHIFWLCPGHHRPPNGESFIDLMARTAPAIDELSVSQETEDIIAVTHGGTIRAALSIALGMDPERALSFSIDNVSLTRIDRIETQEALHWHVVCVNKT